MRFVDGPCGWFWVGKLSCSYSEGFERLIAKETNKQTKTLSLKICPCVSICGVKGKSPMLKATLRTDSEKGDVGALTRLVFGAPRSFLYHFAGPA